MDLRQRRLLIAVALALGGSVRAQGPRPVRAPVAFSAPASLGRFLTVGGGGTSSPYGSVAQLGVFFDASRLRHGQVVMPPKGPAAKPPRPAPAPPMAALDRRASAAQLHQELVVPVPRQTPAYRRTFRILLSRPEKTDRFDELLLKYARRYRLDARLLKSIMAAESEFDPQALSPAGARGLMQVMPRTSQSVGVPAGRLHDPESGIKAGAAYVRELFRMAWSRFHLKGVRYTEVPYWVLQRVIAAYHAGPKFLATKHWFASTRAYVRKVVLFYHSKVTDLRRRAAGPGERTDYAAAPAAASGTLY